VRNWKQIPQHLLLFLVFSVVSHPLMRVFLAFRCQSTPQAILSLDLLSALRDEEFYAVTMSISDTIIVSRKVRQCAHLRAGRRLHRHTSELSPVQRGDPLGAPRSEISTWSQNKGGHRNFPCGYHHLRRSLWSFWALRISSAKSDDQPLLWWSKRFEPDLPAPFGFPLLRKLKPLEVT